MNHAQANATLHTLLQQELTCTQALFTCLEQERDALTQMDSAQLEALASEKETMLQSLEKLSRERTELAQTAGYGQQQEQVQAFLQAVDPAGKLNQLWLQQITLLQQCQHQNRINGSAIELGRQQLYQILGLLRGQEPTQGTTYQADGQKPNQLGNRSLGSA